MKIKERIHELTKKTSQIFIALKIKKTPWYAKFLGWITVAYALSPIDLIPDFIPIIGYLDDLIILPILILLTVKLIPKDIWEECESEAAQIWSNGKPKKWRYAIPIIIIWIIILLYIGRALYFKYC